MEDIDIPEVARVLNEHADAPTTFETRSAGYWKYKYTAQPYAFYQHTKTKKWKLVQVTPYATHMTNTMINGWAQTFH